MACDGSVRTRSGAIEECPGCRSCSPVVLPGEARLVAYAPSRGWLYDDGAWRLGAAEDARRVRATPEELVEYGLAAAVRRAA